MQRIQIYTCNTQHVQLSIQSHLIDKRGQLNMSLCDSDSSAAWVRSILSLMRKVMNYPLCPLRHATPINIVYIYCKTALATDSVMQDEAAVSL